MFKKKGFMLIVILILLFSVTLTACAWWRFWRSDDEDDILDTDIEYEGYFHRYDPEITITENVAAAGSEFAPGEDIENQAFTRWTRDEMGIVWKTSWNSPNQQANMERLTLALASGDLPDVATGEGRYINQIAISGSLVPLDPLLEEYASPLTKYMIDQWMEETEGTFLRPFTYDGELLAMPQMLDVWAATYQANWIRKDILDELGKDLPDTIEDLENILEAYHEMNPDGVGLILTRDFDGIAVVMEGFGAYPERWIENEDGELVYGSIQPEVKEALATLNEWYEKGWLDREFIAKDFDNAFENYVAGDGLVFRGPWWNIWWPMPTVWENLPEANIAPFPPLKPEGGERRVVFSAPTSANSFATGINREFEYPEALIILLNEKFDSYLRGDKELREKMKEEYDYEFKYPYMERQSPKNPDEGTHLWEYDYDEDVVGYGYFNLGETHENRAFGFAVGGSPTVLFDIYNEIYNAYVNDTLDELTGGAKSEYLGFDRDGLREQREFTHFRNIEMYNELDEKGVYEYDLFNGSPTPTMINRWAYLERIEEEIIAAIIMGDKPVSEFDDFVERWKDSGGKEITEEVNEWYEQF